MNLKGNTERKKPDIAVQNLADSPYVKLKQATVRPVAELGTLAHFGGCSEAAGGGSTGIQTCKVHQGVQVRPACSTGCNLYLNRPEGGRNRNTWKNNIFDPKWWERPLQQGAPHLHSPAASRL